MSEGNGASMTTALCIMNLTNPTSERYLVPDLNAVDIDPITAPDQVPEDDSLILYIVGHAVPDGLVTADGETLDEATVATAIRSRRGKRPTLIVWDVCFSRSLLQIDGLDSWTANYVHIFSCQSYERTWHTGKTSQGPRRTLFSTELRKALGAMRGSGALEWNALQAKLREQLDSIQRPEIVTSGSLQPSHFQVDSLA